MSTNYFALAKHITVFDGDEVNMYDANDIKKMATRGVMLLGW